MTTRISHSATSVRLVRWYRIDSDWLSEVVAGRLLEHREGRWRLLVGDQVLEYPDEVWSLCHE